MTQDPRTPANESVSKLSDGKPSGGRSLLVAATRDTRELWRVVSSDGSSHIFQTKPAVDPRRRSAPAATTASALATAPAKQAAQKKADPLTVAQLANAMFDTNSSRLPTLLAEETPAVGVTDATLATELTSVTQAWSTLSPGIRGAVMALVRAATSPRKSGAPSTGPRRG